MNEKFVSLLSQNDIQLKYIQGVWSRRPEKSKQLLNNKISAIFPGSRQEISLLELLVHGLTPLYATCEIIEDPVLKFEDAKIQESFKSMEEVLDFYEQLINRAKRLYSGLNPASVKGELEKLSEDELFRRLTIMCFHAVHHFSQVLRLHGIADEMNI